jgi:hypothetical protein
MRRAAGAGAIKAPPLPALKPKMAGVRSALRAAPLLPGSKA